MNMSEAVFTCDYAAPTTDFPHFWEHTVGSGHARLALRADWQAQMRRCHDELGFRYVRFHGILDDDMSTFLIQDSKPLYSFFNTDQIFDFLLSIGMKPFIELGFMPSGLSSGDKTVFHYRGNVTPPRDYDAWATLIGKLAAHWVERYGIDEVRQWFFEVWNEPNLEAFYTGKMDDYFKLYEYTVRALKDVDRNLKVGGPATAKNAWIPEFMQHCTKNNLPVDFVSTHHYPTDAFGLPGDDTLTQLAKSYRSVLRDQATKAKEQAQEKPLYYTEWNGSSNPRDPLHDDPYTAAFIVKTVMEAQGLVEGYSWWTFSDIFEENYFPSIPFHGGFGLLNIHGIAKPAYRAFELLHLLGNRMMKVDGKHETVDVWVTSEEVKTTILVTNFSLPRHSAREETVQIILDNIEPLPAHVKILRIDKIHANAKQQWLDQGKPEYLSAAVRAQLQEASKLIIQDHPFEYNAGQLKISVIMPPLSVAAITIEF